MEESRCTSPSSSGHASPTGHAEARGIISRAVKLLQVEHRVAEIDAYSLLIHAAVESHSTVRDTATRVVDGLGPGAVVVDPPTSPAEPR